jgi:hypothetical protein
MMKAARTSEMLVNFYQTTRRYNPEDSHLCIQHFKNPENHEIISHGLLNCGSTMEMEVILSPRYVDNHLHGVTQKNNSDIFTAVRTSNHEIISYHDK